MQIVAWGATAEAVCKYKKAGDRVEVTGTAEETLYKPEGEQARLVTEISASRVEFLD